MTNEHGAVPTLMLIAPHQFPDLDREAVFARAFGLTLHAARDQKEFSERMPDACLVMVTPYAKVGRAEIERMRGCKGIIRYGIGYDNIDVQAASEAGVPVSIVPDASTEEVASHALAMGLALLRRIPQGQAAIGAGGWAGKIAYDAPPISRVDVGIVGLGRIGTMVARWWRVLGARVSAYDPVARVDGLGDTALDKVLTESDVVSLHMPLTPETKHVISRDVMARMRRGAVVINVSRGGLIDESALADSLAAGHLAGAGLDVFEVEPLPVVHVLRGASNVLLTPHVAWRSAVSLAALQERAVERARLAIAGESMPDLVTRAVGSKSRG